MKRFFQQRFGCYGLTLPLGRRTQVELWFAPRDSVIPMHTHPHIESHLMFLGGAMTWELSWPHDDFCRVEHRKRMGWRQLFRSFRVAPNCRHGALTTGRFGLFANFERWLPGAPMTSAAVDLELTEWNGGNGE